MIKVTLKENTTKIWEAATFNFKISSNGYSIDILYKIGLIPTYQRSLSISIDDIDQLIESLIELKKVIKP